MVEEQGLRKEENASANALCVPHVPYFATSWASKEDLGVNCDFMGEKWSKLQRSCYVKVCYNQSVVFCFCWNPMQPGWRVQVVCLHHEEQARGSETRPASWSTMGPSTGVHWTFGFVQRPRFSATAPNMGQRPQVNGPRSGLSVTTKTATTVDESVKNE